MVTLRASLETAFHTALRQLDPALLMRRHADGLDHTRAHVLLALGKAAPAMARGVLSSRLAIAQALVITTDGTAADDLTPCMEVLRAAHPVPDQRSQDAGERALQLARAAGPAPLLVCVSGGASAIVCAPPTGMSLEQKQRLTDALLRSGADIREVNVVRRHLSRIKGGHLAAACSSTVHTAIVSDVVDGAPHDVGSGPSCADPTTCADADEVLRTRLGDRYRMALAPQLRESVKPDDTVASRTHVVSLCGPVQLAQQVAGNLRRLRLRAWVEQAPTQRAGDFAAWLAARAAGLGPGCACVVACEPTVQVPARHGRGGRAGWVALAALQALPPHTALLAGASDGVDGDSGAGGACVEAGMAGALATSEIQRALGEHDDSAAHAALGSHLDGGPTGVNLTDVYVVARSR
jgi:hydroxypyruvate reductase